MKKIINGYSIYKDGTWCEVIKEGKFIFAGSVNEKLSYEDIYIALTAKLEFRLHGKLLLSYSLYGTFQGEKQSTLELLAYENNCNINDIEVKQVVENIQ
ncbi:TPA: hypothetical protein KPF99_003566 [Clostridioides difficile]|uniref:Uncharacterized protein n=1 Tax=Clostridioides difficile TaxID=1496 RepID=A0A9X8WRT9_CLODI|nr:hypothetical protein [Clostridioides difficile]MCC0645426.1 hypothetical protein [Clostridioides sp. ZZV14-6150]MCC0735269.1 hypothetical protein [Clostridioides sp. ZZV14-6009]EGT4145755.1 hypothetical protein [Clostridioides difficile]EGT4582864.1 hypothetical protein [Clostridioides difficile]EGT4635774.1 hypothetical protein [Clostridioides difficile]